MHHRGFAIAVASQEVFLGNASPAMQQIDDVILLGRVVAIGHIDISGLVGHRQAARSVVPGVILYKFYRSLMLCGLEKV